MKTIALLGCALATACTSNPYYPDSFRYVSDKQSTGFSDCWKSPARTVEEGGDCEDLAILVHSQLPPELKNKSTLEIWRENPSGGYHAVLKISGRYYSSQGEHGETVAGYTYHSTIPFREVQRRIRRDNAKKITKKS